MDVATSAAQPAGRRFQRRKRILHAGNTPDRERIFGEPADAVPLPGPYMARLAEYTSRISRGRRYRIASSGKSFTVINNFIRQFIEKSFCLIFTISNIRI